MHRLNIQTTAWYLTTVVICLSVLITIGLGEETDLYGNVSSAQIKETVPITLKQGEPLKQNIKGSDTQTFSFELSAGQYAQVLIEWQDMDLDVLVRKPDRTLLFPTSIPVRGNGPIPISVIADQSGSYLVEVTPVERINIRGSFDVVFSGARQPGSADRDRFMGLTLMTEGQAQTSKPQAIEKYLLALERWQNVSDSLGRAYALQRLANAYFASKDSQNAEKYYQALLELRESLNDPQSVIYTRREIGQDFRAFSSPTKAIQYYQPALQLARDIKNRRAEAALLFSIGFANQNIGHMNDALQAYDLARQIQHDDLDQINEARTLNAMGGAYNALGNQATALNVFTQAVNIFNTLGDNYRAAIGTNNIALAHDDLGDLQQAKDKYFEALAKFKSLLKNDLSICKEGAPAQTLAICNSIANTSDNIGELFNTTGDPQSGLATFQQSLPIRESFQQPRPIGLTLSHIAYSYFLLGQSLKAIEYCERALEFNRRAEDLRGEASSLTVLGMAQAALNHPDDAFKFYQQARSLQLKTQERRGEGITLNQEGTLYLKLGDFEKAARDYNLALQIWRDVKDQDGETITLYNIAKLERERGGLAAAHNQIQNAIAIVESRRATLNSQRLLTSYFANKQDYYELAIDVAMNRAKVEKSEIFVAQALEVNELARGRRLLESLTEARVIRSMDTEAISAQNPALKALVDQQSSVALQLSTKANARTLLLGRTHSATEEMEIENEIEKLTARYDDVEGQIRRLNPEYGSLTRPEPLKAKDIQAQLDDDTLLLEFALGEKRSYVWAVTRDSIKGHELPPRKEIEDLAGQVTVAVRSGGAAKDTAVEKALRLTKYIEVATVLSHKILGPVDNLAGKKRLAIVADGALQLIPFAALPIPGVATSRLLVEDHEIVNLPSASVLAAQRQLIENRKPAPALVAVIADPVFDASDARVQSSVRSISRTRGSRGTARDAKPIAVSPVADTEGSALTRALEKNGIGTITPLYFSHTEALSIINAASKGLKTLQTDGVNQTKAALAFDASRATVIAPDLSRYQIIHFATHGILDLDNPELSGLVLSLVDRSGRPQNGYFQMHEIFKLKLPAELVVLSACQTGTGKQVRGEGLIALTRAFMYAGAARVVASLWKVDDAATAALMARFYEEMFTNQKPPVVALRDAQIELSKQKRWKSPYYWAGFVLQGEWR